MGSTERNQFYYASCVDVPASQPCRAHHILLDDRLLVEGEGGEEAATFAPALLPRLFFCQWDGLSSQYFLYLLSDFFHSRLSLHRVEHQHNSLFTLAHLLLQLPVLKFHLQFLQP